MKLNDASPDNSYVFRQPNIRNCQRYVMRIQQSLDKAVADGCHTNIRYYSYLLGKRSKAVKILSVYKVCYVNSGRHTAGIDGVSISKDREIANPEMLSLLDNISVLGPYASFTLSPMTTS